MIDILGYLHSNGIVHRDMRIPNVIFNRDEVYLVDFGLARPIDNAKCRPDVDFSYLGDFLLYLHYSTYNNLGRRNAPWYKELDLFPAEKIFFKRLLGLEQRYKNISEVKTDFLEIIRQ